MDNSQLNLLLELPFPNNRTAEIIYEVLRIDIEPSRSTVKKTIKLDNNIVKINLLSPSAINLRVAVNAIFDNLHLATETLNVFGPPGASFDHYNNESIS